MRDRKRVRRKKYIPLIASVSVFESQGCVWHPKYSALLLLTPSISPPLTPAPLAHLPVPLWSPFPPTYDNCHCCVYAHELIPHLTVSRLCSVVSINFFGGGGSGFPESVVAQVKMSVPFNAPPLLPFGVQNEVTLSDPPCKYSHRSSHRKPPCFYLPTGLWGRILIFPPCFTPILSLTQGSAKATLTFRMHMLCCQSLMFFGCPGALHLPSDTRSGCYSSDTPAFAPVPLFCISNHCPLVTQTPASWAWLLPSTHPRPSCAD